MNYKKYTVNIFIVTFVLLSLCEARGGRRGGSFGGLFGSWRKYKKPSSGGGNARRIVSSSPVHTPITKAWHENKQSRNADKFQKHMYNSQALPTGGSYYQNTAALPGNVIYVPQAPPRGSEFGNFLTGYLTGRLLTMGYPSPHHHVTHVYKESPPVSENTTASNNISQVVIINSPLIEFTTRTENLSGREAKSTTTEIPAYPLNTAEPPVSPYGVICVPMVINEKNSNGETIQNERIVCYPAPAPPTPEKHMKSQPVEIAGDIMEH